MLEDVHCQGRSSSWVMLLVTLAASWAHWGVSKEKTHQPQAKPAKLLAMCGSGFSKVFYHFGNMNLLQYDATKVVHQFVTFCAKCGVDFVVPKIV